MTLTRPASGPVAASWQPRAGLVGTYNVPWQRQHWPWFPEDFDYGYFNAAPRDQQVEGFLKGGENLVFENLHPKHPAYSSRLPGRRAGVFFMSGVRTVVWISARPHWFSTQFGSISMSRKWSWSGAATCRCGPSS